VALAHDEGWRITQTLIDRYDVIPDFRPPNLIRLGIAPLYNEPEEIDYAVDSLERIVRNREFMNYASTATGVT
jgi:kynureninase